MTFEGQYLTLDEYIELGGSQIEQMPFDLLEFEARRKIDSRTQNRLRNEENIPQEVKLCVFNLINTLETYINTQNRNVQSESVGEYSVSYGGNIKDIVESKNAELDDIIIDYLYGVIVNGEHVIYNGVA